MFNLSQPDGLQATLILLESLHPFVAAQVLEELGPAWTEAIFWQLSQPRREVLDRAAVQQAFALHCPLDDEPGLIAFTAAAKGVAVVGDDYLVTNAARVRHAAEVGSVNTALIKPNQAGTLTETRSAFDAARAAGFRTIVSARSGETEDVSVAHLAVGWGAEMLKVGSFTRSERMAKWNEGLRIAEALGDPPLA